VKYARQALAERTQAEEGPPRLAGRSQHEWALLVKSDKAKQRSPNDLGGTKPSRRGFKGSWQNEAKRQKAALVFGRTKPNPSNAKDGSLAERSQADEDHIEFGRTKPPMLEDSDARNQSDSVTITREGSSGSAFTWKPRFRHMSGIAAFPLRSTQFGGREKVRKDHVQ
jgi:hypothetical protein